MATVELNGLTKRFNDVTVVQPATLTIDAGEFVVLVGPSGCGKSTLLRMIAGLETATAGTVAIGGQDVTHAPPAGRGVAMVFQSYALYPHLSVADNIAFPLKVARLPKAEIAGRVQEAAAMLDLVELLARKPRALSGGQRQRVSIARAIVRRPQVLLLDEPLSNLDTGLRARMRHEFARLHQQLGMTMIYVTHDQLEAMTLANRIVVMHGGRIEQVGAPLDVYRRPASLAVAQAIGSPGMNLLPATIVGTDAAGARVRTGDGAVVQTEARVPDDAIGRAATLGVRPEHLLPDPGGPFSGGVELFERLGPLSFAHLGRRGEAGSIVAQLPGDRAVKLGEMLHFAVSPADTHLFAPDGSAYPLTPPPSSPVR
ncbi:sugar ABC transporter ATP-binding protein [Nostoc sp. 3335mG]|nr:sugar ABC transporter ATP-binding protein [Nostoc sp. 3335mG]